MKLVINQCYGGFGLSYAGVMKYAEIKGIKLYAAVEKRNPDGSFMPFSQKDRFKPYDPNERAFIVYYLTKPLKNGIKPENSYFSAHNIPRYDPALIKVVELLGKEANGDCAELKIIKIPDGIKYLIEEYDGKEWVSEEHRIWR